MTSDTDLSGMDPDDAREYITQYIITLQKTRADLTLLRKDLETWSRRASLAAEKGREDLKAEALKRCLELTEKEKALATEELSLTEDVETMQSQLDWLKRQPKMSVNAGLLLEQLQQVVGEEHLTSARFRETEADAALAELKQKLGESRRTANAADTSGADRQKPSQAEGETEAAPDRPETNPDAGE